MAKSAKRLMIIDISSFIFRAFYAIRPLNAPDGTPVNAVYGVLSMLLKIFQVYKPTHVLLAKETKGGSFRNEVYELYKANRGAPPDELVPQFNLIEELTNKLNLPMAVDDHYEADDIIGSACVQWKKDFDEILIASGDKDLMQFVGENVKMVDTMKDKIYDRDEVYKKMQVYPEQIVDYLSIVGDSSDNIPGMKGIGAKGAAELLSTYQTLENCIKNKDELKGKRLQNAFENHLEDALLSKKLIQIVTDLDLKIKPENTNYKMKSSEDLFHFFEKLGFDSMIKKFKTIKSDEGPEQEEKVSSETSIPEVKEKKSEKKSSLQLINEKKDLAKVHEALDQSSLAGLYPLYTKEEDLFTRRVAFLGITTGKEHFILPFKIPQEKIFGKDELFKILEKTWGDEEKTVIGYDLKSDMTHANTIGLDFKAKYFDLSQADFVADPSRRHDPSNLIETHLKNEWDLEAVKLEKKEELFSASAERYAEVLAPFICALFPLYESLNREMEEKDLAAVYHELDAPLIPVLAKMERQGVDLDLSVFSKLEIELEEKLSSIQDKVSKMGHGDINLNSPKQVGELLFDTLGLPIIKKTKTGPSTDSEVLEELASRGESEIPELLLQFRELGKLQSTYVKAFPALVNSTSKRLHTSFHQNLAQTGRLSSTHPNLQNIPIRTEMGRKIRKGFIAGPGHLLLGADYSQVELRILAHFSNDTIMKKAFKDGIDIHSQTASEVMGVALDKVTSEHRSKAKAVNFGLMYGQSSFGLAKALRISRGEAKEYIDAYFMRFKKVKAYLDSLRELAEEKGYSETLKGRKRYLPDIHSSNRTIKANAQRMAINSPIQGTAADIIKLAMLKIQKNINATGLSAKMILQVHDELIFEFPKKEEAQLRDLVREGMESVAKLSVPLLVEVGVADNWYDLK